MIFRNPLALIILPVFLVLFLFLRIRYPEKAILFPTGEIVKIFKGSVKSWLARRLIYLKVVSMALMVVALARPQLSEEIEVKKEGIAIILCVDVSSTMLAEDLELGPIGLARLVSSPDDSKRLNRIDAVREVARDFIKTRTNDLVGIVAFAAQAYVVCPPTFDRKWLLNSLERVKVGLIKDATSIGSGILSSLNSLKSIEARSKVIILLTDGINNFGKVPPLVAAQAARSLGIKIYTIGIVSKGQTPYPTKDVYGRKTYKNIRIDIDTDMLRKIANLTGGEFYSVTDIKSLKESYAEIDKLEKVELEEAAYEEYKDIFSVFLLWGLGLLVLEIVLSNTFLRRIP